MTPEELKKKILSGTIVKQADGTFRLIDKNSPSVNAFENFKADEALKKYIKPEETKPEYEKIKDIAKKSLADSQMVINEALDFLQGVTGIKRR